MKSSKKLLIGKISVPIYGDSVYLFLGKMEDLIDRIGLSEDYGDAAGMCGSNSSGQLFIAVSNENNKASVLAHELFHLVMIVCGRHGVLLEMENNEAGAYLYGWLYEKVLPLYGHRI